MDQGWKYGNYVTNFYNSVKQMQLYCPNFVKGKSEFSLLSLRSCSLTNQVYDYKEN